MNIWLLLQGAIAFAFLTPAVKLYGWINCN